MTHGKAKPIWRNYFNMEPLEKKLVLEREITRLVVNEKQLKAKVEKLESEQLDLVDLKTKAQKEITELNEKKSKVLKEISEEKTAWFNQKTYEEELLRVDKVETRKILNRAEFVALQESKNKAEAERLTAISQDLTQREKVLQEGLSFLEREKKQAEVYTLEQQKLKTDLIGQMMTMKNQFIEKVKEL